MPCRASSWTRWITCSSPLRSSGFCGRRTRPTTGGLPPPAVEPAFLFLKDGTRQHKVGWEDILFVEGLRDYVAVHTHSQKIVSLLRLKALIEQLPADRFVRIHHSYIISLAGIEALDHDKVQVAGRWLPVSASYHRAFRAFVDRYRCRP